MKKLVLLIQVVYLFPFVCSAQEIFKNSPANPSTNTANADWMSIATQNLEAATYHFKPIHKEYVVLNKKQGIAFSVKDNGIQVSPVENTASWNSGMEILSVGGYSTKPVNIIGTDAYLRFENNNYHVEYINNENGLRQNFIVKQKNETGNLHVQLKISGSLIPSVSPANELLLTNKKSGKVYLQYDGLKVWDATHKALNATMQLQGNLLTISVDDANAVYPVTIDPLTHAAEWTISADGLLPGLLTDLQLQVDALVGYSMAGVGDVNGDGYDDVAIGAPGAIDIIAGPSTIVGAGAVFVYFGSASGLPSTPSRVLRATTPVANALFGFSIAGGNVTATVPGDTKSDIVIGAPGESYSTSVSGLPSTATVTAGKVYIFSGETLASGPASPLLSIYLNGSGFFSNGVVGILLSNVGINALFGFSVAVAGDMTNDGLGEVVVGSPGYAGVQLLSVRSGSAFVYYSSNLASNTPVQLNPPSLLEFPLLSDINGLLFGFSVDGAGDYNKDGKQDVVVGAPGGLSISLNNLLGGSAYIYAGKTDNTGVRTDIRAQLTAGGSLLGPVANLFGYSVKGARDASGNRTGAIMAAAPSGNVLSNLLGGLRLKTGTINIFKPSTATGTHTPSQTFSSPRASTLLSILALRNLDLSVLFGASMDNMRDVNCDGIGDIIVGEPLSTNVGLLAADALAGGAYIYLGKADSTYNPVPYWSLQNTVSQALGINAASLIGYSVAGAGRTYGSTKGVRALVGAPGKALDFSSGVLALGNTLGTLLGFVAGGNGLGKSFGYGFDCGRLSLFPDMNTTFVNVSVPGDVHTNDVVPAGTIYGTPEALPSNPAGAAIALNSDGTYTFTSSTPGIYNYNVPACVPGYSCIPVLLTVTVTDNGSMQRPPIANTDIAATKSGMPVTVKTLANDMAGIPERKLVPSSVTITVAARYGAATVNSTTGDITYTSRGLFTGMDTVVYTVNDDTEPVSLQASAMQVIQVLPEEGGANTTLAADDYVNTIANTPVSGNVKTNDTDPEGNVQNIAPQNVNVPGKGIFVLNTDGTFTFTPEAGFTGPVSFVYNTCDDGTPQACAGATLYITVSSVADPDLTPSTRISNGTFIEPLNTVRNFVIEVNEIYGNAIDNVGQPVRVRVFKSDNFSYSFEPEQTNTTAPSVITVHNPDWSLVQNTSTQMVFELKAGSSISGYSVSRINIGMQVLTGAAEGTETITVGIYNGSGKEANYSNNSIVRILNIVH
ncbi:MAG: Ig-like domain-containing protein [Ferruginibacter sp.]